MQLSAHEYTSLQRQTEMSKEFRNIAPPSLLHANIQQVLREKLNIQVKT